VIVNFSDLHLQFLQEPLKKVRTDNFSCAKLRFGGGTTMIPVDLADDIDGYRRHLEDKQALPEEFISTNPKASVDGRMRSILVDW